MEETFTFKVSAYIYQTERRYILEGGYRQSLQRRKQILLKLPYFLHFGKKVWTEPV